MDNGPSSLIMNYCEPLGSVAEFLRILAGICWTLNYFSMMRKSHQDRIPSTGIFPLCCDIGWEFVYAFVYPASASHWQGGVAVWFLVHCAVILSIIRFAPDEWSDYPLIQGKVPLMYGMAVVGFALGQWALALQIGPDLGFFYGGVLCQTLASLGPICQLLCRNTTRGASILTWSLRFTATVGGFIKLTIYYFCGIGNGPWFESPMCCFYIGLTLFLDCSYPIWYSVIRRQEEARKEGKKDKTG